MSQRVRKRVVRLTAVAAIQLDRELILPSGRYPGESWEIGLATLNGMSWTKPEYKIEFTAQELSAMGMKNADRVISIEIDVTKYVRSGQLAVS